MGCGPKWQRTLTPLVLGAALLAGRPSARGGGSCSPEGAEASPSPGSLPSCLGEDGPSDVEDGASLIQLSERKVTRRPNTSAVARESAARAEAQRRSRDGEVAAWLQLARRRRDATGSLFGTVRQHNSQLLVITLVAFALAGVAVTLIFCRINSQRRAEPYGEQYYGEDPGEALKEQQAAYGAGHYMPPAQAAPGRAGSPLGFVGLFPRNPPAQPAYTRPPASAGLPPTERTLPPAETLPSALSPAQGGLAPGALGASAPRTGGPRSPPPTICPELPGAVVPNERKFMVKVPPMLHVPAREMSVTRDVVTAQSAERMFEVKILRCSDKASAEEYFSINLPEQSHRELALCSFHRMPMSSQLQCEIFKTDGKNHKLFGRLMEDTGAAPSGTLRYTLHLESGRPLLHVVVGGDVKDRNVKVWDGANDIAATVPGDTGENQYQVECFPRADVVLTVIVLVAVDRLNAAAAHGGSLDGT